MCPPRLALNQWNSVTQPLYAPLWALSLIQILPLQALRAGTTYYWTMPAGFTIVYGQGYPTIGVCIDRFTVTEGWNEISLTTDGITGSIQVYVSDCLLNNRVKDSNELNKKGNLSGFPDPTDGPVSVSLPDDVGSSSTITLTSLDGKRIWTRTVGNSSAGTYQLDLGPQPAGLYLLTITTGEKQHHMRITRQ
jgi:hypothetical protein